MSSNTHSIGEQIKSGVKGIHGVGEAIRGTVMDETDKAFDTRGSSKNADIAQRGIAEAKQADQVVGHNHGVKSATSSTVPGTSDGAHAVAPGTIGSTGSTVGHGAGGVQEQPGVNQRF